MPGSTRKAAGVHFTPAPLARLMAERVVAMTSRRRGPLRLLDPACGDGNLLAAMRDALPARMRRRVTLVGVETDAGSLAVARRRLAESGPDIELICGDFLDLASEGGPNSTLAGVDAIVANPPYVRTQVMGAARSQALALRFGLTGRVDLYQAFLVAMAGVLKPGGALGVISSNRFLTTRSGAATRTLLDRDFELVEVVDLGDTKLFDAAVLPALVFAIRRSAEPSEIALPAGESPRFTRIYQELPSGSVATVGDDPVVEAVSAECLTDLVRSAGDGSYRVDGLRYRVARGSLVVPSDRERPWRMATDDEAAWIRLVEEHAAMRLGDVAQVRVGVKTTADGVFIRNDWDELPSSERPECEHLHPLLGQENAARWRMDPVDAPRRILYPHTIVAGRRAATSFAADSPTWAYLTSHRKRLESRTYVIEAGRQWYEIWVPQDPAAWAQPKIVFPDISPEPRFFLDRSGALVDGNCYWITPHHADEELLLLILGVANSSVMARYHDLAFPNRLYAGRKRHLTQYVREYPLPDRTSKASRQLCDLVRSLTETTPTQAVRDESQKRIDQLAAKAFGLPSGDG